MIIEKTCGHFHGHTHKNLDIVTIQWFERDKKVLRKTSKNGLDIGLKVDTTLNDGDVLFEDDQNIIVVEVAPTELILAKVSTMEEMGKLCFELGNRHLSLKISSDSVKVPFDMPTFEYLQKLGFTVEKVVDKFTDFSECHAHGHSH